MKRDEAAKNMPTLSPAQSAAGAKVAKILQPTLSYADGQEGRAVSKVQLGICAHRAGSAQRSLAAEEAERVERTQQTFFAAEQTESVAFTRIPHIERGQQASIGRPFAVNLERWFKGYD